MVEYKDRLAYAMKLRLVSIPALHRALGISYQAVKKVLDGGTTAFSSENNSKAAAFLNVSGDWLATGREPMELPPLATQENRAPYETGSRAASRGIPVVGTAQLGDNAHFCELAYPVGHGDGFIDWASKDGNAYALRCKGDSMKPRIRHGEFVVIEPNHQAIPGDEVLVRAKDGRVMVKQWAFTRDGMIYLDSVNEAHPRISVPTEDVETFHYVAGIAKSALWHLE